MSWLTDSLPGLLETALKTALIFLVAVGGLRAARRRTVAQWTVIDVVTAVSVGAVVGRTATADTEALDTGIVALVVLIGTHAALTAARRHRAVRRFTDHRVRVLVAHGEVRHGQLRTCGLTLGDLEERLRLQGVVDLSSVRFVLFERQGGLTVVRQEDGPTGLVASALDDAEDWSD